MLLSPIAIGISENRNIRILLEVPTSIPRVAQFMYRRPILCTLYGAVDFLNVLKKGCWGGEGGCVIGTL